MELSSYLKAGGTYVSNLVLQYYRHIGLNEKEVMLWMQVNRFIQQGVYFPNMQQISDETGVPSEELYHLLEELVNKKVLAIESAVDQQGRTYDQYNVTLIYRQIEEYCQESMHQHQVVEQEISEKQLFQEIEVEFGRTLSPIERETIGYWLTKDGYGVELISLALKEAVLNQAYSLKYMDRILLSWERKNIRNAQDVEKEKRRYENQMTDKHTPDYEDYTRNAPRVPLYNWLDPSKNNAEES